MQAHHTASRLGKAWATTRAASANPPLPSRTAIASAAVAQEPTASRISGPSSNDATSGWNAMSSLTGGFTRHLFDRPETPLARILRLIASRRHSLPETIAPADDHFQSIPGTHAFETGSIIRRTRRFGAICYDYGTSAKFMGYLPHSESGNCD
jgi:hypothetical protein